MDRFAIQPKKTSEFVVKTNYFRMNFDNRNSGSLYKFSIDFEPEIPEASRKIRAKIINSVKEDIVKKIGQYKFIGNCIYALSSCDEGFTAYANYDSNVYTVSIK